MLLNNAILHANYALFNMNCAMMHLYILQVGFFSRYCIVVSKWHRMVAMCHRMRYTWVSFFGRRDAFNDATGQGMLPFVNYKREPSPMSSPGGGTGPVRYRKE